MSKTGVDTLAFDYDANGIRTSKTVNSIVTTFTVVGNQITQQQTGDDEIFFFYDPGTFKGGGHRGGASAIGTDISEIVQAGLRVSGVI